MFVEDFSVMFSPGAPGIEPVTIGAGPQRQAMVDRGAQLLESGVLSLEVSILLPASWAVGAAEGQAVTLTTGAHQIRQVLDEPPDAALKRLILVKV